MKNTHMLLIAWMLFCTQDSAPGAVDTSGVHERITITVMKFEANNCPADLARAVTDMVTCKLFENERFMLLDRSIGDFYNIENELRNSRNDSKTPRRSSSTIPVEKVVVGSISKIGDYRIETRIINVMDGKVDITLTRCAGDEDDIEEAVGRIMDRVSDHYLGIPPLSGDFDALVCADILRPVGDFRRGADKGYGAHVQVNFNKIAGNEVPLILRTGYRRFTPSSDSIASHESVPLELLAGREIPVNRQIRLVPAAGGGYLISRIAHDIIEERTYGRREYESRIYYNPVLSMQCGIDIKLDSRWYFALVPSYSSVLEREHAGHILGIAAGIRILF